jgi:hypothetical protein
LAKRSTAKRLTDGLAEHRSTVKVIAAAPGHVLYVIES